MIAKYLKDEGGKLLEVDDWFYPDCYMPKNELIARIGARVYFGDCNVDSSVGMEELE